ncbi:SDR family oxidoreductase [Rhodopseudomonas palustris]|uniref:SDR family oxidoreductase n=1 Tax=Rhodopseudomonas palustris TaxID=1076 RepID=UPI000E5B6D4F|nr:SDR family oxidoreductase [Rhodopseudomonas palustris]QLH72568.1 SDR family oxidoreductase [Rhodopseudomonas palustris]RIA03742.1 SDR family oxidoreductase [Rhodopseudomonas palustris]
MSFAGKAALVTGGSKGIGFAIARALAQAGASVMICARDESEIAQALPTLRNGVRGRVHGLACDVRDEAEVRQLVDHTVTAFDGLDILVNNAGVGLLGPVETFPPEHWRLTLDTNLTGAFYCCHYAIPALKARGGGAIVNIGSRSSVNAYGGGAAYCASKFGLLGLSESLLQELHPFGIRVSCVMPGRVATDFAGEPPQDWHLSADDVAQAVIDVLSFAPRALASRIELRPARPPSPAPR